MEILIVGAGLSGLSCAAKLSSHGFKPVLLEASDRAGGRIKTDNVNGFRLDRGLQVVFTAYPAFRQLLDLESLNLKTFEPGSRVKYESKTYTIHYERQIDTLFSPIFGIKDKIIVAQWTEEVKRLGLNELDSIPNIPVRAFLEQKGFSEKFIVRFAVPFFGGIFLDRSLETSARWFAFIWKMLSEGHTAIPELGMEEIPKQLERKLPKGSVRCNTIVKEIFRKDGIVQVRLEDNSTISADRVVIATESGTANNFFGIMPETEFRSTAVHYFETNMAIDDEKFLILNADPNGISREIVPMTNVSPKLAPYGRHLVSVATELLVDSGPEGIKSLIEELGQLFPEKKGLVWNHIRSYKVPVAQLKQTPEVIAQMPRPLTSPLEGVLIAGELQTSGSTNGALRAGQMAADRILEEFQNK